MINKFIIHTFVVALLVGVFPSAPVHAQELAKPKTHELKKISPGVYARERFAMNTVSAVWAIPRGQIDHHSLHLAASLLSRSKGIELDALYSVRRVGGKISARATEDGLLILFEIDRKHFALVESAVAKLCCEPLKFRVGLKTLNADVTLPKQNLQSPTRWFGKKAAQDMGPQRKRTRMTRERFADSLRSMMQNKGQRFFLVGELPEKTPALLKKETTAPAPLTFAPVPRSMDQKPTKEKPSNDGQPTGVSASFMLPAHPEISQELGNILAHFVEARIEERDRGLSVRAHFQRGARYALLTVHLTDNQPGEEEWTARLTRFQRYFLELPTDALRKSRLAKARLSAERDQANRRRAPRSEALDLGTSYLQTGIPTKPTEDAVIRLTRIFFAPDAVRFSEIN